MCSGTRALGQPLAHQTGTHTAPTPPSAAGHAAGQPAGRLAARPPHAERSDGAGRGAAAARAWKWVTHRESRAPEGAGLLQQCRQPPGAGGGGRDGNTHTRTRVWGGGGGAKFAAASRPVCRVQAHDRRAGCVRPSDRRRGVMGGGGTRGRVGTGGAVVYGVWRWVTRREGGVGTSGVGPLHLVSRLVWRRPPPARR